jgi:hypothetical protein
MELISDRSQKNKDKYPSIHCFNTFFCTTLLESGYAKLRRWTKRVDIFAKDMVLIPVNSSLHWTLAVFDFRKKQLAMYDSLGGNNMRLVKVKAVNTVRRCDGSNRYGSSNQYIFMDRLFSSIWKMNIWTRRKSHMTARIGLFISQRFVCDICHTH